MTARGHRVSIPISLSVEEYGAEYASTESDSDKGRPDNSVHQSSDGDSSALERFAQTGDLAERHRAEDSRERATSPAEVEDSQIRAGDGQAAHLPQFRTATAADSVVFLDKIAMTHNGKHAISNTRNITQPAVEILLLTSGG